MLTFIDKNEVFSEKKFDNVSQKDGEDRTEKKLNIVGVRLKFHI